MATDKTEPRLGLIVGMTILVVTGLVVFYYAITSYFIWVTEDEQRRKIVEQRPEQLMRLREDEERRLHSGPMPIERAMALLASGQRPAEIAPRPSTDSSPLQGWSLLPRGLSFAPPAPPSATEQPVRTAMETLGAGTALGDAAVPSGTGAPAVGAPAQAPTVTSDAGHAH